MYADRLRDAYAQRDKRNDLHDELTFGRYKGCTIQDILDSDPQYLEWLTENSEFPLSDEAYTTLQHRLDEFQTKEYIRDEDLPPFMRGRTCYE